LTRSLWIAFIARGIRQLDLTSIRKDLDLLKILDKKGDAAEAARVHEVNKGNMTLFRNGLGKL
jgi:ribosomal 50S subunit-associated protein YjgA (DUF615 family)